MGGPTPAEPWALRRLASEIALLLAVRVQNQLHQLAELIIRDLPALNVGVDSMHDYELQVRHHQVVPADAARRISAIPPIEELC